MGRAARQNPRSRDGGKPAAYVALHRLWRMVDHFQGDKARFDAWVQSRNVGEAQRRALDLMWSKRYPAPLVTPA